MAFRCAKAVEAGLCTGGECCGIIPVEVAIYEKYRDQVTVPVTNVKVVGNYRLVETSDLLCAFMIGLLICVAFMMIDPLSVNFLAR